MLAFYAHWRNCWRVSIWALLSLLFSIFSPSLHCLRPRTTRSLAASLQVPTATSPHSPPLKYFLGGNIPWRRSSWPRLARASSDQFTQLRSFKPKK